MNKKSIFISRELRFPEIWQPLIEEGFTIHAESLIHFTPIPYDHIPPSDWLYFYSKNAVKYFQLGIPQNKLNLTEYKIAAHGLQTAAEIREIFKLEIDFVYNPTENNTSQAFMHLVQNKKVLFIQAQNSMQTIQNAQPKIDAIKLAVYNNEAKKNIDIPLCKHLLFTSPLNVNTYFTHYDLQPEQNIVAIGNTTLAACLEYTNGIDVAISEKSSEQALLQKLLSQIS